MPLTLYRRHTKSCSQSYKQNHRIFRPLKPSQHRKDCSRPINAEGKLGTQYITNRSTHTGIFDEAENLASDWSSWGSTKPPVVPEVIVPTVSYAVKEFLNTQVSRGLETSTYRAYSVLLDQRLVPWAGENRLLADFDDLHTNTKFIESWRSLTSASQKWISPLPSSAGSVAKPKMPSSHFLDPQADDETQLKDSTKSLELGHYKAFLRYCKVRKWLKKDNLPSLTAKKLGIETAVTKKFGMEPEERSGGFLLRSSPVGTSDFILLPW